MYPVLVLVLAVWMLTLMDGVADQNRALAKLYQSHTRHTQIIGLAENLEQFFNETGTFPASINTLSASSGFQHVRGYSENWQGYAVSPQLNDGVWRYHRAVLFSNDPTRGVTQSSYLATNACGAGGYSVASSWCGAKGSKWFRRETRERFTEQLVTQRIQIGRMLQKLADYYNSNKAFPNLDNLGIALAADSNTALKTLAGYAGTAQTCTGTYQYMGVPVDCGDMFDLWGNAIGYHFVSNRHILLISETPLYNASGTRIVVAVEYDFSLM